MPTGIVPDSGNGLAPDLSERPQDQKPHAAHAGASSTRVSEMAVRHVWPPQGDLTDDQERMRKHGLRIIARPIAQALLSRSTGMQSSVDGSEDPTADDPSPMDGAGR